MQSSAVALPYRLLAFCILVFPVLLLSDMVLLSALATSRPLALVVRFGLMLAVGAFLFWKRNTLYVAAERLQAFARYPYLTLRNKIVLYAVLPVWGLLGAYMVGLHVYGMVRVLISHGAFN